MNELTQEQIEEHCRECELVIKAAYANGQIRPQLRDDAVIARHLGSPVPVKLLTKSIEAVLEGLGKGPIRELRIQVATLQAEVTALSLPCRSSAS